MLADTTASYVNAAEKGGDWPNLNGILSNNSSIHQLQNDIVDWFRENRPEAVEVPAHTDDEDKGNCEAALQPCDNSNAQGTTCIQRSSLEIMRTRVASGLLVMSPQTKLSAVRPFLRCAITRYIIKLWFI